jgi:hypothetical protein
MMVYIVKRNSSKSEARYFTECLEHYSTKFFHNLFRKPVFCFLPFTCWSFFLFHTTYFNNNNANNMFTIM